ncbi:hypothetical protein IG631_22083 [Alternaria alternata]|nr:hypothetical protein IG631_22083 [Alternaria alternata]
MTTSSLPLTRMRSSASTSSTKWSTLQCLSSFSHPLILQEAGTGSWTRLLVVVAISEPKNCSKLTKRGIWLRDVRQAVGGASNTWIGTDIEDSYFPNQTSNDTSYHHQSMTEPWPLQWQETFVLVHSRMALPGVGLSSLEDAVMNLVGLVKPGGWIQLVEMQWQDWDAGPVLQEFQQAMRQLVGMVTNGQGVDMREGLTALFEKAGLTKVQHAIFAVTVGVKAKEDVRELSLQSMFATASFATATLKKLQPVELEADIDSLPARLVGELRKTGGSYKLFALWAQKPEVC